MSVEDENHVAKFSDPFHLLAAGIISLPIDLPGTPFNKAIKASNFIKKELLKIIRQRKMDLAKGVASATQDILSHMLLTCNENGEFMSELDIADKILGLLIGGHDTASVACTFIVKYLADLPHIYDTVFQGTSLYHSISKLLYNLLFVYIFYIIKISHSINNSSPYLMHDIYYTLVYN